VIAPNAEAGHQPAALDEAPAAVTIISLDPGQQVPHHQAMHRRILFEIIPTAALPAGSGLFTVL
jgi:hypothetical protein